MFYIRLALLFLTLNLFAREKTICLNMIVKNESEVICRCLESVKPYIDTWVIVDTGSSDGTQETIKNYLKEIPGELFERPWVDFSHNRNEALELARNRADYVMYIDADEVLQTGGTLDKSKLDKEIYVVHNVENGSQTPRIFLVDNQFDTHWEGVIHEQLIHPPVEKYWLIETFQTRSDFKDGFRSKNPNKHLDDAKLLQAACKKDPHNFRYPFYLGQSYLLAKEYALAIDAYEKSLALGSVGEFRFYALLQIGACHQELHRGADHYLLPFEQAHDASPNRLEPIFALAYHYFAHGDYATAYTYAKKGLAILEAPETIQAKVNFQLNQSIYDYRMLALCADIALNLNLHDEVDHLCTRLLKIPSLPEEMKNQITQRQ